MGKQDEQEQEEKLQDQAGVLAEVQARRRLAAWLDLSGMGTALTLMDVVLSIISVASYITSTYGIGGQVLWFVDFFCAVYFAACFLLGLWLSDARYAYIVSWHTLVDILTIIPPLVLAFVRMSSVTTDVTTAAAINFLRVLRLVRIIRLLEVGARMAHLRNSDVLEALMKLVLSVICMLVLGAGAFYELERFQPVWEEKGTVITYHSSIYWAAVTLTTVGYGDFAPSWALTQMLILVYLCMTFTVLPYLTGNLLNALNATTPWQRSRHHTSNRAHLVLMGRIRQEVSWRVADEIFHADKGFAEQRMVMLAEGPPTPGMRSLLNRHTHASKIKYLQGSPFVAYDLERALLEYAGGVFILADTSSPCPGQADLQTIMTALAVGEYLQHRRLALERQLAWMGQRLLNRILLRPTRVPQTLPRVVVQLLLPESVQQLQRTMTALSSPSPSSRLCPAPSESFSTNFSLSNSGRLRHTMSKSSSSGRLRHSMSSTKGRADAGAGSTASRTWHVPESSKTALSMLMAPAEAVTQAASSMVTIVSSTMAGAVQQVLQLGPDVTPHKLVGCPFWSAFQTCLEPVCVQEVEQALMCHSALGVPGVVTLLHNLVVTRDVSLPLPQAMKVARYASSSDKNTRQQLAEAQAAAQPPWLSTYLRGASMEMYLLVAFPSALWGLTYTQAARFIYDNCQQAVLLSVTLPGSDNPLVMPTHLVIGQGMGAHLICEDLLAIGDVFDSTPQQVADWAAVNSVEVAQARGFEPRSSLDLFGDKQKASPRKEGSPLVAFDEEQPQPQPQGGPPPMPRAGTSNGSLGKLSTALQRLFPNSSFGSEGSEQSQAHRQKKRARSKGNVVVVQTMRAGQAGETPVLLAPQEVLSGYDQDERLLRSSFRRNAHTSTAASYSSRYHLLPSSALPASPADLVVPSVSCSGHVLVVSAGDVSMHSIASLVLPFRSRLLPLQPHIVVVIRALPDLQSGWAQLAALPKVHLVMAGPTAEDTLSRAGAAAAGRVLLLAGREAAVEVDEAAALVQSTMKDAVMMDLYHLVRAVNPSVLLVTELHVDAACSFLSPLDPLLAAGRDDPAFLTPAFMAGQVMLVQLVDYMALQAYQVPGSMRLLLQLIRGWRGLAPAAAEQHKDQHKDQHTHQEQQHQEEQQQQEQASTCHEEGADEGFNSCSSHLDPSSKDVHSSKDIAVDLPGVSSLCSSSSSSSPCVPTLVQLRVSADQEGMMYGALFHQLLATRGVLLLGLYRPVQHQSARFDCVMTNPPPDTIVTTSDHLFVVAPVTGGKPPAGRQGAGGAWPHDTAWWA